MNPRLPVHLDQPDDGQSILELALLLPFLCVLFFGAADLGRVCYYSQQVINSAHTGAIYGSRNHALASDIANITSVAQADGGSIPGGLSVTVNQLCAASYADLNPSHGNCTGGAIAVEYVEVDTGATIPSVFRGYGFGPAYTLHGRAVERVRF